MIKSIFLFSVAASFFLINLLSAQNLQIISISPENNSNNVNTSVNITIQLNQNISSASLNDSTIVVRGSQSGIFSGVFSGGGSSTIAFNPDKDFRLGESISFTITTSVKSDSGFTLARGHTYSFTVQSGVSPQVLPVFAQRIVAGATAQSREIQVMDYNSNGVLDLVSATEGLPERIYVHENDGNNSFCSYSTGGNFRYVEVFDIDGDGDYDNFGATGSFDTKTSWFENEGTTPYTEHVITADDPWTMTGGDLDSDGDIDVVVSILRVSPVSHRLRWFANDGSGNFTYMDELDDEYLGDSESFFYIRDMNSDGALDVLALHRDDYQIVWYENNGFQSFSKHLIDSIPDFMRLETADIDNDLDLDFVVVSQSNSPELPIAWYENDGNEDFTRHPINTSSTQGRLYVTNVTDLDGDQDIDIIAGGYWFENDGDENFTEHIISEGLGFAGNYYSYGLDYADMDEDGDMDIVSLGLYTTNWHENVQLMDIVEISPGNGTLNSAAEANITITFDQSINAASVNSSIRVVSSTNGEISGTFSGGGGTTITFDPDNNLLAGDRIEVSVNNKIISTSGHKLKNNYGFSFQVASKPSLTQFTAKPILTHSNNLVGIDISDLNDDGYLDILTCSYSEIYIHMNDGAGSFLSDTLSVIETPVGIKAVDYDNDGFTDILVDNNGSTYSTVYYNDGEVNFTPAEIQFNSMVHQITDFNNDGDSDILYLSRIDNWLNWLDYHCQAYISYGYMPRSKTNDVAYGDLDNDGDNDAITAGPVGPILYNNDGYFYFLSNTFDDNYLKSVDLADIDGDGDLDPIFTENFSGIIWYENLMPDSLSFGEKHYIDSLDQDPRDAIAVDLDGDGDMDVAAVSRNDDMVVWYENRLNQAEADFGPRQLGLSLADGPTKIIAGDMDSDGDMDLVTISDQDDELIWFENTGGMVNNLKEKNMIKWNFSLQQNYPNPFNPITRINYQLAKSSKVRIKIYDISGREVKTLVNKTLPAGNHFINFDGSGFASGVYFYKIEAGNFLSTKKMLLLK